MKTLEMTFATSGGGTVRIAVPNPKLPVDPIEVANTMELLVAKQAFSAMSGNIVGKKAARVIDHTVLPVSFA
ncbi:DUF2922 domain-containing protein [Aneurinibacillus sp. UBA3580]|jgi:hypothetical protein|uniref:DUF2922 domain-containing protein n=1 Tax=Aneurinibacillus sp. UBA3580 TaxID=1946041 RepID=UPI00257BA19F|nr:DUF2922 domain-containing protein [Aneurinibacillus sp. UBA3580]